jgi:hypothetical protein
MRAQGPKAASLQWPNERLAHAHVPRLSLALSQFRLLARGDRRRLPRREHRPQRDRATAFSGYFGAPLASPEDAPWVIVYALRTGLIAAIIALLLAARQLRLVGWVALLGAALPVGDFLLAQSAGAPPSTLLRHAAIGVFLLVTAWRLFSFPHPKA